MSTVPIPRQPRGMTIDMVDLHKECDTLAQRIVRTRKQMGMTRPYLCKAINIGQTYMQRIEKGSQEPSVKVLRALAVELDVSMDYLCCLTDRKDMNYD